MKGAIMMSHSLLWRRFVLLLYRVVFSSSRVFLSLESLFVRSSVWNTIGIYYFMSVYFMCYYFICIPSLLAV